MDGCVRIERAQNGYTVSMRDPKIVARNMKRDMGSKGNYEPYVDPNVEYVFADFKSMSSFLEKNLDKALPKPDYETAFNAASAAVAEDD